MKRLPLLLLLLSTTAFAAKISTDHDTDYDFTVPQTVAWGEVGTPAPSELTQRRIVRAIEAALGTAGLRLVEGPADLQVIAHAAVDTETQQSSVSVGIGLSRSTGWGGIGIGGSREVGRSELRIGTLVVHLLDTESGYLIWEGRARETFDARNGAEKIEAKVDAAVEKLFRKFPPKPKRKKKR